MRHRSLPPPVELAAAPASWFSWALAGAGPAGAAPHRARLPAPHPARFHARRFFDPVAGRIRRIERGFSRFLSRRLFAPVRGLERMYAVQLERGLTVSEAEVPLPHLPPAFDGTQVLLVTDLHAGPFLGPATVRRVLARLAGLEPDLILLGGDVTTNTVGEIERCRDALGALRAPLGVFGVLGNHDHYTEDPPGVARVLEAAGVRMLTNRAVALRRGDQRIVLAGVDDWNAGRPDLRRAMDQADALVAGDVPHPPTLLLSHNPDAFFAAARRGAALVLSGHTHGGQIRLPGLPVLVRMSRYRLDEGRYRSGAAHLVVSRGLGVSGLPLRLGCPPEVVLLTLRAPARAT